jgi:hypothetical protein
MARKRKDKDAAVWADPSFQNLAEGIKKILKVPKEELERREAEYKKTRGK